LKLAAPGAAGVKRGVFACSEPENRPAALAGWTSVVHVVNVNRQWEGIFSSPGRFDRAPHLESREKARPIY
jgi:hypothetical protein